MTRFVIIVVLLAKLALIAWLAGLGPSPVDRSELWSRAQRAIEVLRGGEEVASDAQQWQRAEREGAAFGEDAHVESVTVGGPGLVAVGWDGPHADERVAAVWTSLDGISWRRVPHDEAVFGGSYAQWMSSVTVGGPGFVAVGSAKESWDDLLDSSAAVWTSIDGVHWRRIAHDETVFGGDGWQRMQSVTAGGPGLVAVGRDSDEAAIWTSADGANWQRARPSVAVAGSLRSVIVGGPGLVAVGRDPDGAVVWTSP